MPGTAAAKAFDADQLQSSEDLNVQAVQQSDMI